MVHLEWYLELPKKFSLETYRSVLKDMLGIGKFFTLNNMHIDIFTTSCDIASLFHRIGNKNINLHYFSK